MTIPFSPPIQRGIHMTVVDEHFRIAISIKNLSDEDVTLSTMNGSLFNPSMEERTFSEEGIVRIWQPYSMTTQAVTRWTLPAGEMEVQHYDVPNERMARERAEKMAAEEFCDETVDELMEYRNSFYVTPSDVGVVRIESGFPAIESYYDNLTRQFDLRGLNWKRNLDTELPAENSAIEGLM